MPNQASPVSAAETLALHRAIELARTPGVPLGPNPRVGCVLLDASGDQIAEGFHRGAGSAHAEAAALAQAGRSAQGATAVVTLEPCNHTGRTGPCTEALIDAGVRRVVYAQADPNPIAAGGAGTLRRAGVEVAFAPVVEASTTNRYWTFGLEHDRPYVTWKFGASLDGRSAARDGTSQWITSETARRDVQRLRALSDVVLVGTGTVLADDPALTLRDHTGAVCPAAEQPLRAVMGLRPAPAGARVADDAAETLTLVTHDPAAALKTLFEQGRRHVLLEGGPTIAAAFVRAGLVDEVVAYLAPVLLGSGMAAVADLGIDSIGEAMRLDVLDLTTLGEGPGRNVRLRLRPTFTTHDVRTHETNKKRNENVHRNH